MQYKTLAVTLTLLLLISSINAQVGEVIWEENFNNLDNWGKEVGNGSWGWGNGELEFYKEENVEISSILGELGNNALHIIAKKESGANIVDQWGNPLSYTSGKVTTKSKIAIKYGVIETRVMVPNLNVGGWPAIWLLGTANYTWPRCGELDIMEMGHRKDFRDLHDSHNGGNSANNSTVNMVTGANAIFYSDESVTPENPSGAASISWDPDDDYCRPYYNYINPLNNRFVTYRLYWDESSLRFTVIDDGIEHDLYTEQFPIDSTSSEFQQPFYLIANLAIGGAFTDAYKLGDPNSGLPVSMPFPAEMFVDYIKVMKWNGQGEVNIGPPTPENGTFGIFTDNTLTNGKLEPGISSEIYVWEGTLTDGTIEPFEGENGITWKTVGSGWFGAGIMSIQPRNFSNFAEGNIKFMIKIPANVTFQIGIIDSWGNQSYVEFPANQTKYGLVRDGNWAQASIPVSEIRGEFIDLRMLSYEFVILNVNGAACEFALDDIYWDGGGIPDIPTANAGSDQTIFDSNNDGSELITLDGSKSVDLDGTIENYSWTENETEIASGISPSINLALGIHKITLKVTDNESKSSNDNVTITIFDNYKPIADAGENQTVIDNDENGIESITLDASKSSDSDGSILSYLWKENGAEISTLENPTLDFNIGTHLITLTVTDNDGESASDNVTITVNNKIIVVAPAFCFTEEVITIDENIESAWNKAPAMQNSNVTVGTKTNDFYGQWKGLFDETNLYVLVEVTDETQINDSGVDWYKDDCVEFFIDGDNNKGSAYDGKNDFLLGFRWNDDVIKLGVNSVNNTSGIAFSMYKTDIGYNLEVSIPWATIGVTPITGNKIGFDIAIDDDDNGGDRECAVASIFTEDNAWYNPSVLGSIGLLTLTDINDDKTNFIIPTEFSLEQNFPNPFNPSTIIKYSLPEQSSVKIQIFNMLGQQVSVLVDKTKSAGYFETTWNAVNLPSGIYLININAVGLDSKRNFTQVRKALLLK